MLFRPLAIDGAFLIEPTPSADERGLFARIFDAALYAEHGLRSEFPQRSVSYNHRRGTLRGLHMQAAPHAETKIIRCTAGAVHDVVVDLRPGSPSFGQHVAVELSASNRYSLYVPRGCAHGFQTLCDETEVYYEIDMPFEAAAAIGVRYDDPALQIAWPLDVSVIGDRDLVWPALARSA